MPAPIPAQQRRSEVRCVRLTPAEAEWLDAHAAAHATRPSAVLRTAINALREGAITSH